MDKEFIKDLVENKSEHIKLKKAEVKTVKGGLSTVIPSDLISSKAFKGVYSDSEDKLERTIIGNTYNWLDSHGDVHGKNCFKKSITERSKDIFHLHDHEYKITSKVGEPQNIYEESISWKDLGINKSGETQSLMMDSDVLKEYNSLVFNGYKNNSINQHSVGMQYVKIDLAVNDEEYEDEYKVWIDNIEKIGNPEKAEEQGYFWLVREAKLIEISAVLRGSNELTPTMESKNIKDADVESHPDKEVEKSLQQSNYYKSLI
jgi:hypothetical protein